MEGGVLDAIVVFITTSSLDEAKMIGEHLVEEHLVACVNIVDGILSIFFWAGKLCSEHEKLLIVKSVKKRLPALIERVQSLHSYDVPEIIALPIVGGASEYLNWIETETEKR